MISSDSYAELTQEKYPTYGNRRGVVKIKLSDRCITSPKPVCYEALEHHLCGKFVASSRAGCTYNMNTG